jgi:predicted RNase H-like HicB family nuclease
MMRYAIVIEKAPSNYAAYVPDLPGCIATGATVEETESLLREAIELHLEGMRENGVQIPEPASVVEYVDVMDDNADDDAHRVPQAKSRSDGG